MRQVDVINTYSQLSRNWIGKNRSIFSIEGENERLVRLLPETISGDDVILDIGSGTGKVATKIRALNFTNHITAIDPSLGMCAVANVQLKADEVTEVLCGFVSDHLGELRERFSLATALQVLHHIEDLEGFLGDVRTTLTSGGRFVTQTIGTSLHAETFEFQHGDAPDALGRRSSGDWITLLSSNGFVVETAIDDYFTMNFANRASFVDHLEKTGLLAKTVHYTPDQRELSVARRQAGRTEDPSRPVSSAGHHITIIARKQ